MMPYGTQLTILSFTSDRFLNVLYLLQFAWVSQASRSP